jgi:glyoxalase superfamily protein
MMLIDPQGRGLPVSLAGAPPHGSARVHLDLYISEQARHMERLTELGAACVKDWPYPPDADFIVMRDPDGENLRHRPWLSCR